ncbi:MAG: hypothetical protein IJZ49_04560, partial [Alistipes sp.]|nr:hypothetical protein [Alistipes sp.]
GGVTNLSCWQMIATQLSILKMIVIENKFSPIIFNPDNLRLPLALLGSFKPSVGVSSCRYA